MEEYFVSVIIPTYNRAIELDRCLNSLTKQSYKKFEVLVCDDGSTDHTKTIVDNYNSLLEISYIKDKNFGGPAKPRNSGIRNAKGDIIAFLDSDDWWDSNKIVETLGFMKLYDFVYCDFKINQADEGTICGITVGNTKARVLNQRDVFGDLLVNGNCIVNSSVFVKRSIIDKVGFFSEDKNLIAVEDYDYWLRIARVTNQFYYLKQNLGFYWIGLNISFDEKQIERDLYLLRSYDMFLNKTNIKIASRNRDFSSARLYHRLGNFKKSKILYFNLFFTNDLLLSLKSIVGYFLCVIKLKK